MSDVQIPIDYYQIPHSSFKTSISLLPDFKIVVLSNLGQIYIQYCPKTDSKKTPL